MSACLICLEPGAAAHGYHAACVEGLFGTPDPPCMEEDLPLLKARLADLAGGLSLSGVQPKALARVDGGRLVAVDRGGTHVLKPPVETYPSLPENEHLTMVLARHAGIRVPPLKNLSLLERSELPSSYTLSPAYDLLCTRLVLPKDKMALLLNARTQDLKRRDYLAFASRCSLSAEHANAVIDEIMNLLPSAVELVERSFLPDSQKTVYMQVLRKRCRALRAD